jgi:choline-phosphate cytidylyltransferase
VLNESERAESVRHCRWVDQVIQDAPWIITQEFLDTHRIDFVAHDAIPYHDGDIPDVYAYVKSTGKFLETHRTSGVSTSGLIARVLDKHQEFTQRNKARGIEQHSIDSNNKF